MEQLLKEILETQREILLEMRLLRLALTDPERESVPPRAARPAAVQTTAAPVEQPPRAVQPTAPPPPQAAPEPRSHSGKLTLGELSDIGGAFLEGQHRKQKGEVLDAGDLRSAIMEEILQKNRDKRNAFADFERRNRER